MSDESTFEQWCIVELFGHRRLGALVSEQQVAGAGFVRLDVPMRCDDCEGRGSRERTAEDDPAAGERVPCTACFGQGVAEVVTQFYAPSAVFSMTPTTQDTVYRYARQHSDRPVQPYELAEPAPARLRTLDAEEIGVVQGHCPECGESDDECACS